MIVSNIQFPDFTGVKCNMMPFIQGNPDSLPETLSPYRDIIASLYLQKGEVGFLTIDESYVTSGKSQRGYGASQRCVHVEVGQAYAKGAMAHWGGGYWGGRPNVYVEDTTEVIISNSLDGTCRYWDVVDLSYTVDGDLSEYLDRYPEHTGVMLSAGEVAKIGVFTPHECVPQKHSGNRQFFRIVGSGVRGREPYFTTNPLMVNA